MWNTTATDMTHTATTHCNTYMHIIYTQKRLMWSKTADGLYRVIGLFCKILSLLSGSFAKETCNFIDATNWSRWNTQSDENTNTHSNTHFKIVLQHTLQRMCTYDVYVNKNNMEKKCKWPHSHTHGNTLKHSLQQHTATTHCNTYIHMIYTWKRPTRDIYICICINIYVYIYI